MNPTNRMTCAALLATTLALFLGCGGGDEGPGYLKGEGEAPPLSAETQSAAMDEDRAVADAERAEAANYMPASRGKSKR